MNIEKLIEAGYLTVFSKKTKTRFCFSVTQSKDNENLYFVGIHNKALNPKEVKFPSLGYFFKDKLVFKATKNTNLDLHETEFKTFSFMLENINNLDSFTTLEYEFKRWYGTF